MKLNSLASAIALAGCGAIGGAIFASVSAGQMQTAEPVHVAANPVAPVWREATPEQTDQIWEYVLQSPLGIAALNQLAIEGFINPTCERTFYTHAEYDTFQTLLQVECSSPRGASGARTYDEIRVTFNRFEETISDFSIERVDAEMGAGNGSVGNSALPDAVAQAVLNAAARQAGVSPYQLEIVEAEPQTWPNSCLGLGGPAESCLTVLTEGWRVVVSGDGNTWVFRTDTEGNQVRLASSP